MKFLGTVILFGAIQSCHATFQQLGAPFKAPVTVSQGFAAHVIFSNLTTPRGITIDSSQNILVIERGLGVTAFSRSPTLVGWDRTVVIQNTLLTQGIQVDGRKLYVSTAGDVLLYDYNPNSKSVSLSVPVTLITGIPPDGDLTTHTLQLEKDAQGHSAAILVASGPLTNIDVTARDPASGRSQVRRFTLLNATQEWVSGQVIAFGIRNPAGIAFQRPSTPTSTSRTVFVVENGASVDNVTGLTAAFVNDNPADELELVTFDPAISVSTPKSFGFPDCTTLWNPRADPIGDPQFLNKRRGDQFSLNLDTLHNDAFCQNSDNNRPPLLSFQAHSVPLDIKIFQPTLDVNSLSGIPGTFAGDAFISFHGSFDRTPPTGYGVVRVPFPVKQSDTVLGYSFLIQAANIDACPGNCIRPVGLAFAKDNRLYVTSDSSGELFVIEGK